ncbi:glycoside hydrolase family 6 protein [Isoptericola sp. 4D.3]|uniref:Glucanase n=1 Tax=Isoptericola peretonis TaxID=2918523 RepID=A0ABT0J8C9_9MICO|nr:glycoside hydrolase family 6 protein [Isoptericola sp. 4D.3]
MRPAWTRREGASSPRRARAAATTTAALALVAAPLAAATTAGAAEPRVDNPFAGATQYVNEYWSANVEAAAGRAGGDLGDAMLSIADEPTSVWMDRISAIEGNADGPGLRTHLDAALAQKQGDTPLVFNLVIYDLPGRDCYALASNGELPATAEGMERYETEYIDAIAAILDDPAYEDLRIVATIEPDSLPNLVTNSSEPLCQTAAPYYRQGVAYALDRLYDVGNVYSYIDAAHAGWLGWPNNAQPAAQLFADVVGSTEAGFDSVAGFVTNTANSTPLVEPFLQDENFGSGGFVRQAGFYEWNPDFDETDWTAHLYDLLVAEGFPSSIGMLIDTSRNGWGGPDRPTAESTSTDLNTYVNESRVDRRTHRGAWCNPAGAGIGERPQVSPAGYPESHLDAFVWVKPPGESDGSSEEIPNDEGKHFDRMCDPTFNSPKLSGLLTGALPDAPLSGKWFEAQFRMLVTNAYPAIGDGGTNPDPDDTTAPSVPQDVAASADGTTVEVTWSPSTDDTRVTGYQVSRDGEDVGSVSGTVTSFTDEGLAENTRYSYTVTARDAAGNVSAASAPAQVTTGEGGEEPPAGACTAVYSTANSWSGGYQGQILVTAGADGAPGWEVTAPAGLSTTNLWGGTLSGGVITGQSWNADLAPGATATVGFVADGTPPADGELACG